MTILVYFSASDFALEFSRCSNSKLLTLFSMKIDIDAAERANIDKNNPTLIKNIALFEFLGIAK